MGEGFGGGVILDPREACLAGRFMKVAFVRAGGA